MVGHYKIYNDNTWIKSATEKIQKVLRICKDTLKETIQLEDYEESGFVNLSALKEAFQTLDIEMDDDLMDYLLFVVYQKSQSIENMSY